MLLLNCQETAVSISYKEWQGLVVTSTRQLRVVSIRGVALRNVDLLQLEFLAAVGALVDGATAEEEPPHVVGGIRGAATGAADEAGVVLRGNHTRVGLGAVGAAQGVTVEKIKGGGLLVLNLLQAATSGVILLLKDGQAIVLDDTGGRQGTGHPLAADRSSDAARKRQHVGTMSRTLR